MMLFHFLRCVSCRMNNKTGQHGEIRNRVPYKYPVWLEEKPDLVLELGLNSRFGLQCSPIWNCDQMRILDSIGNAVRDMWMLW